MRPGNYPFPTPITSRIQTPIRRVQSTLNPVPTDPPAMRPHPGAATVLNLYNT